MIILLLSLILLTMWIGLDGILALAGWAIGLTVVGGGLALIIGLLA